MKISVQIQAGMSYVQQALFQCKIYEHMEFLKLLESVS